MKLRTWLVCVALVAVTDGFSRHFDLIIAGGTVVDGTGAARRVTDVGVIGDTIVAVGDLTGSTADRRVEAKGLLVTPGFIDPHAHVADGRHGADGLRSRDPKRRAAQNFVLQGITTGVTNPDGGQTEPLPVQRQALETDGIGINVALLTGHEFLRQAVMGKERSRPATADEVKAMKAMLEKSLAEEGSFGLSTGLEYVSMLSCETSELVALARSLVPYGGLYHAHQRSQGSAPMWYKPSLHGAKPPPTFEQALNESMQVAETGATVLVTHIKAWGPGYRGNAQKYVDIIQAGRDRGLRVFCDLYPYFSAGSDGGFVMLPPWAFGVSDRELMNTDASNPTENNFTKALDLVLKDPSRRADLARDIQNAVDLKGGEDAIMVLNFKNAAYNGKSIGAVAKERGLSLLDLAIAFQHEGDPLMPGGVKLRAVSMDTRDVATYYRQPWTATGTDGWIVLPEEAVGTKKYLSTNQRCFGTFTRRLALISEEMKVDSLEEAVRKSTTLSAEIANIPDRGRLTPGYKADILVIDLANLRDSTTLAEPSVYPTGMQYVWVNGTAVVENGKATLKLPGKVLDPLGRPAKRSKLAAN